MRLPRQLTIDLEICFLLWLCSAAGMSFVGRDKALADVLANFEHSELAPIGCKVPSHVDPSFLSLPSESSLQNTVLVILRFHVDKSWLAKKRILDLYKPFFKDVFFVNMVFMDGFQNETLELTNETDGSTRQFAGGIPRSYECGKFTDKRNEPYDSITPGCVGIFMERLHKLRGNRVQIDGVLVMHSDFYMAPGLTRHRKLDRFWGSSWTPPQRAVIEDNRFKPDWTGILLSNKKYYWLWPEYSKKIQKLWQFIKARRPFGNDSSVIKPTPTFFGSWSDMYYVPWNYMRIFFNIAGIFAEHGIMNEIVVPTARSWIAGATWDNATEFTGNSASRVSLGQMINSMAAHKVDISNTCVRAHILAVYRASLLGN